MSKPEGIAGAPQRMRLWYADPAVSRELVMICGLAAPFGVTVPAANGRPGRQQFVPGCFDRAIRTKDVSLRLDHDEAIVGTSATRALRLWEGADGLFFCFTPQDAFGRAVLRLAASGSFGGVSVAYPFATSTSVDAGGVASYHEVDLTEISLVPAYSRAAYATTWARTMTASDARRLEAQADTTITMKATRAITFGGLDREFHRGETYTVSPPLAQRLIALGVAN